ncbi:MAG: CinA family protein [Bacillales bacterium]|nr:CinA family protein [Bacillales bacterium]
MEISEIFKKLEEKGLTFGSIESMTGGLFATTITNVSGASKVYKGSIITYTSEEKINIVGVNKETIDKETVVSSKVAQEMAMNGQKLLNVDICLSITGNAGPTVEKGNKQVGEAYIGICFKGVTAVASFLFKGDRNQIRASACKQMIDILETFAK